MIEERSAEPSNKNRKCPYLRNRWTDFKQTWRVHGYTMQKYHFKKTGPTKVCGAKLVLFYWKVLGLGVKRLPQRCAAPSQGTKHLGSRCTAPSSFPS